MKNSCDYFADVKTFDDHIELLVNNSYSFRINLIGEYNAYNTLAAIATAIENGFSNEQIQNALNNYHTAFGRAETRIIDGHKALIQLIKNPTGVNEVLKTIDVNSHIIFAMNDEYADGRDISWLWDVDFSKLLSAKNPIVTSGTRAYDIANRLKYAGFPTEKIVVEQEIKKAIQLVLNNTTKDEKITILPSYTALLKISKY